MVERQIGRENVDESYAKQTDHFHVVTESGTELWRSDRQINNLYKIGSLFSVGGTSWVVIDIWEPMSCADSKWTIVVRPET